MEIEKSAMPLYEQICNNIRETIASGKYKPGDLLPSEAEYQKAFGVSRITVRRALKVLCEQGILRGVQGKGTYINDLYSKDWTIMRSFSNDVIAQGHVPSTKILRFKKIKASLSMAKMLEIEEGTELFAIKRLRYIDDKPFWLTASYVLCDVAPQLSPDFFSRKGRAQSLFFVLHNDFALEFKMYKEIKGPEEIDLNDIKLLNQQDVDGVCTKASLFRDSNDRAVVYESTILAKS